AVIGAWLEDVGATVDVGVIYIFTRSGSTWTFKFSTSVANFTSAQCGWSVALSQFGDRAAFGCPGTSSNTGFAALLQTSDAWSTAAALSLSPTGANGLHAGDRYGEAVAVNEETVFVGAPSTNSDFPPSNNFAHDGEIYLFDVDLNLHITKTEIRLALGPTDAHF